MRRLSKHPNKKVAEINKDEAKVEKISFLNLSEFMQLQVAREKGQNGKHWKDENGTESDVLPKSLRQHHPAKLFVIPVGIGSPHT